MKVRCVKNNGSCFLDVGKVYEVLAEPNEYYLIKTELGRCLYLKELFEIVEEDKMENFCRFEKSKNCYLNNCCKNCNFYEERKNKKVNKENCKIKIDDKVILKTDIAFQVPYPITKGDVLNVDSVKNDKARVSTKDFSFVIPLEFLIKVNEEKEEIRVIKKLEDLDGLENGMGLVIKYSKDKLGEFTRVQRKIEEIEGVVIKSKDKFEFLKSMGFKFEYKPLRTVEEVLEEIKAMESLPFVVGEENWSVACGTTGYYKYIRTTDYEIGTVFMTEVQAQRYVDELNEIIGVKNVK